MDKVAIRLFCFLGLFILVACWELVYPRRSFEISKTKRWLSNISLIFLGNLSVKLILPLTTLEASLQAETLDFGFFNFFALPYHLEFILSFIFLDFSIYLQHIVFHKIPFLWKIHRVHHVDLGFDVSTGVRFHPFEIILSMFIKIGLVFLLGVSPSTVFFFELILNGASLFNHGNIYISSKIDKVLRCFVVTPDMHRVHHSSKPRETHSNFGFNLPWWDYLFGTYIAQSQKNHKSMEIGLPFFRDLKFLNLFQILILPFKLKS